MNKYIQILLSVYCMHVMSFAMDSDVSKQIVQNRLQKKYPTPINWNGFETENLDEYTQAEVAPFLFTAVSQKAPVKIVRKILDEKELSPNVRDDNENPLLTLAILNQNTEAVSLLINSKAKVIYEMDKPQYSGAHDETLINITPWQAACMVGLAKYARLLHEKMPEKDKRSIVRNPMYRLQKKLPIDYALINKKSELAQFLCSIDPYLMSADYDSERAINAAKWPDATYLKMLFDTIGLMVESDKHRLLFVAVNAGNLEGTQFLISKGAQVDTQMCACAALREDRPLLHALLATGISLKTEGCLALTECLQSTQLRNTTPITLLLAAGAQPDENKDFRKPIHRIANKYFDLSFKQALVTIFRSQGTKLDTQDRDGCTLLHHTCDDGLDESDDQFMFYLLDLGANANICDKDGRSPFLLFCKSNRNPEKLAKFLKYYAPEVNAQDNAGNTPLVYAAKLGKKALPLIAMLINYHADITKSRNNMLHAACQTLNIELAQLLLETHGASATSKDYTHGKTILMNVITAHNFAHKGWSCRSNSEKIIHAKSELIDLLVKYGADLNAQDSEGKTVLHHAVLEERPCQKVLEKLLTLGACATIRDNQQRTPLEIAMTGSSAFSQDTQRIRLLLAHTKESPFILSTGQTPIEYLVALKRKSSFDDGNWHLKLLELFTSNPFISVPVVHRPN